MSFVEITQTFIDVAQQYRADTKMAFDILTELDTSQNFFNVMKERAKTDTRDFIPLVMIMGVNGNTPEERQQDIMNKIEHLTVIFADDDHSKRNDYLNMIYNLVDTFDPATADMENPNDVAKLFQCLLMDQAIAEKRNENPEYFQNRYPTKEARVIMDSKYQFITAISAYVDNNLNAVKSPFFSKATLPKVAPGSPDAFLQARLNFAKIQRDQVIAAEGAEIDSDVIDVPITDEMLPLFDMTVKETAAIPKSGTDTLVYYLSYVINDNLLNTETKEMLGYKEAKMSFAHHPLYIDGMPFADFLKKHLPDQVPNDLSTARVLSTCLLNGRHQVDFVRVYRDENGVMQYKAKTLRPVLTDFQKNHKKEIEQHKYSRIRRALSDWGIFPITPKPQDPNSPAAAERRASICENMKGRIETKLAELEEAARQSALKDEQDRIRRTKLAQEKELFDKSVDLWTDKDSVISILGQQVKGSHNTIQHSLRAVSEKERYNAVSELLAKHVLYNQLAMERHLSKDGTPGPIEASLFGDGKPETIQKNLDKSIQTIAKDDILKDLFFSKVANNGILSHYQFEEMILHGGTQYLSLDYVHARNEADKAKLANSNQSEPDKQNEKDLDAAAQSNKEAEPKPTEKNPIGIK